MNVSRIFKWLAIAGCVTLGVVGCGPSGGTSTGATSTASTSSSAQSSPSGGYDPKATPGVGAGYQANPNYPEKDTPFLKASAALQAAWIDLATRNLNDPGDQSSTIIPGFALFNSEPSMPAVTNGTNGALSDGDVTKLVAAFWKNQALTQWAEEHGQYGVLQAVNKNVTVIDPRIIQAMQAGSLVTDPPCDAFPSAILVVKHDAAAKAWLGDMNLKTDGQYDLVLTVPEGATCALTIIDRSGQTKSVPIGQATNYKVLFAGVVGNDPTLGEVFVADADAPCGSPNAIPSDCR